MELELHISKIKELFNSTLKELDNISDEYYETPLNRAKKNISDINRIREELMNNFPAEELQKNDKELLFLAKQIKNKYDNIITKFAEETDILARKLGTVNNQKKIAKYSR